MSVCQLPNINVVPTAKNNLQMKIKAWFPANWKWASSHPTCLKQCEQLLSGQNLLFMAVVVCTVVSDGTCLTRAVINLVCVWITSRCVWGHRSTLIKLHDGIQDVISMNESTQPEPQCLTLVVRESEITLCDGLNLLFGRRAILCLLTGKSKHFFTT